MKGGRTAPRNGHSSQAVSHRQRASMKGGRTAPRNFAAVRVRTNDNGASMKGGRTAPRNWHLFDFAVALCSSFNEGGADCPPKPGKTWIAGSRIAGLQ